MPHGYALNSFATKRVVNDPAGIYRDFLFNMRDKTGFLFLLLLSCVLHEV